MGQPYRATNSLFAAADPHARWAPQQAKHLADSSEDEPDSEAVPEPATSAYMSRNLRGSYGSPVSRPVTSDTSMAATYCTSNRPISARTSGWNNSQDHQAGQLDSYFPATAAASRMAGLHLSEEHVYTPPSSRSTTARPASARLPARTGYGSTDSPGDARNSLRRMPASPLTPSPPQHQHTQRPQPAPVPDSNAAFSPARLSSRLDRPSNAASPYRPLQSQMVVQELDDLDCGHSEAAHTTTPAVAAGRHRPAALAAFNAQQLSMEQARAVKALLWGSHMQPPASWKQGFFFNSSAGLQFGLVQLQGGPCGVLAAVQGHILAHLHQSGHVQLQPTSSQQQAALVAALADIMWRARQGPVAVLAVASRESSGTCSFLSYDQLMYSIRLLQAGSLGELQDALRAHLHTYMDQYGWGIILLLLSTVLSRGIQSVQGDMDEPSNAMMGMHGYCTQELVNLLIAGQAVSNVFDGDRDLDGSCLHGITRRCKIGLLTLFEWYKYVEVGSSLKRPDLPIWVVCSESHFTVLFAQGAQAQSSSPPFDLLYYDELAQQTELVRLTVLPDREGGWIARVGDTMGDRGRCEGHNIPPLECVIETRWPGVKVDWNGSDPIL